MRTDKNGDAASADRPSKPRGWRSWFKSAKDDPASDAAQPAQAEPIEEPEPEEEEPIPTDWMPAGENPLDLLRRRMIFHAAPKPPAPEPEEAGEAMPEPPVLYSSFTADSQEPEAEKKRFLDDLQRTARSMLQRMDRQLEKEATAKPEDEPPERVPEDALCELRISRSGLEAWLFLFPPVFDGEPLTADGLRELLKQKEITYGVDDGLIERLGKRPSYLRIITVARGLAPVDGLDGKIIDLVPREQHISYTYNEDDTVNYKDLNWLHRVHVGDVLCEIVAPVEPVPGCAVNQRKIEGKYGKKPFVPSGKNTALNEDGTALVATEDGQVSFNDGRFNVVKVLTIPGNVDSSVGNLEVLGDLVVNGDILEGFLVKATGNVAVRGMIEGATVIAGGNIQICNGMNGNNHGTLDAQGDVSSKFLENCTIQCGGCIRSDSMINCNATSNDVVDITSGRGVIIGGTIMACHAVKAKIIGNKSHRNTTIVIGSTPSFLQEKAKLANDVQELQKEKEELEKNVDYLERSKALTSESQALRDQMKLRLSVVKMRYAKESKKLAVMEAKKADVSQCFVQSNEIYPLTQVTIGRDSLTISTFTRQCKIYCDRAGITVGIK